MWHECYPPQTIDECVWSAQKKNEFIGIIRSVLSCGGATSPSTGSCHRAILLYGPSGCGKTTHVLPLIRSVVGPSSCLVERHFDMGTQLQRPLEQLQSFLWYPADRFSSQTDETREGRTVKDKEAVASGEGQPILVQVVKLLSFGTTTQENNQMRQTCCMFLDQLQAAAAAAVSSGDNARESSSSVQTFLSQFRASITVFIFTLHDMHSEKAELMTTWGSKMLYHSSLVCFRCTAITPRSLKQRLLSVLEKERRKSAGTRRIAPPEVTTAVVDRIAETSSGDIRQALLQLQWAAISTSQVTLQDKKKISGGENGRADLVDVDEDEDEDIAFAVTLATGKTKKAKNAEDDTSKRGRRGQKRLRESTTILDLLEDDDDTMTALSSTLPTVTSTTPCRDEYIDVAHASARLLTQKYTARDVLRVVTVPASKLMGYVTTSMYHYFSADQMTSFADCCDVVSSLESFFTPSAALDLATTTHAGLLREDETNIAGSTKDVDGKSLAQCALHIFSYSYRGLHKDVHIPKSFTAQLPPPYITPPFPRWVCLPDRSRRGRYHEDYGGGGELPETSPEQRYSEYDSRLDSILNPLPTSSTTSTMQLPLFTVGDVLREVLMSSDRRCCNWNEMAMDTLPWIPKIVFEHSGSSRRNNTWKPLQSSTERTPPPVVAPSPAAAAQHLPPKKTVFSLASLRGQHHQLQPPPTSTENSEVKSLSTVCMITPLQVKAIKTIASYSARGGGAAMSRTAADLRVCTDRFHILPNNDYEMYQHDAAKATTSSMYDEIEDV